MRRACVPSLVLGPVPVLILVRPFRKLRRPCGAHAAPSLARSFARYVEIIFKRLFRVFAILYHTHLKCITENNAIAHLNTCFSHFMCVTPSERARCTLLFAANNWAVPHCSVLRLSPPPFGVEFFGWVC